MRSTRFVCVMSGVAGGIALLLLMTPLRGADAPKGTSPPCIQWEVKPGIEVDHSRAERLYQASCHWVETNFFVEGLPTKPCVTIKVGEKCPYYKQDNCVDTQQKIIYLSTWNDRSTVVLSESFLLMDIYDKFAHGGGANVAKRIALDDMKNFVDVSEFHKK